jgi:predicted CXXCH cytochrome family protein
LIPWRDFGNFDLKCVLIATGLKRISAEEMLRIYQFRRNTRNLHRAHANNASCYQCHDSHGSEQRHLLNLDTSLNDQNPELLVFLAGYDQQPKNSQSFWQILPNGGTKTCFIECHNQNHTRRGWTYPNYTGE